MQIQQTSKRISRRRTPPIKIQQNYFHMPSFNRYFSKIKNSQSVIQSSRITTSNPTQTEQKQSVLFASRSASLSLTRKNSIKLQNLNHLGPSNSLPKMTKNKNKIRQSNANNNQIIGSTVGCFNFYQIMKVRDSMEKQLMQPSTDRGIRQSSLVSEYQSIDGDSQSKTERAKAIEQKNYEEYDKILLQKEPLIYRRKYFKLKHKADWITST